MLGIWIVVGLVVAIGIAGWLITHGELCLFGIFLRGSLGPPVPPHKIDRTQLARLISFLLEGERFDSLFINEDVEGERGFTLSRESDCDGETESHAIELSSSFLTQREQELERRFRSVMSEQGIDCTNAVVFNEGFGSQLEARSITYLVPSEPDLLGALCLALLTDAYGLSEKAPIFPEAAHSRDYPSASSWISWRPRKDPLEGIL